MENRIEEKAIEYSEMKKTPLLVVFELASPFSATNPVSLDGILGYCFFKDVFGEDFFNMPKDMILDFPLPVEERSNGVHRWFAASFGVTSSCCDHIARWKKRWDEENDDLVDFGNRQARVNHKACFFKSFDMPIVIKNAKEIAFCVVGNRSEIERLLQSADYVGKKRSQGYGKIARFRVDDSATDWSCWLDGRPTRAIPMTNEQAANAILAKERVTLQAYRPPYWATERVLCYGF